MAIQKSDGIAYNLIRRRGMKNIRIRIKDDGSIYVSANTSVPLYIIDEFVSLKADWIKEHIPQVKVRKRLTDGCKVKIFDRIYKVNIVCGSNERAYLGENGIIIECRNKNDTEKIEALFAQYVALKCSKIMSEYYNLYITAAGYSSCAPKLVFKLLKSKWGHFNPKKNEIMLNYALCTLPRDLCIYVIVHEITHISVRNHSPQFYNEGKRLLSDFRELDKRIRLFSSDFMQNVIV